MSVEFNLTRSTAAVLDAIQAALTALQLANTPAFQKVVQFEIDDFEQALRDLVITEDRVAMVVWTGEAYELERGISILTVKRMPTFEVIFADFALSSPLAAKHGDESQPGVLGLLDVVLPALTGVILDESTADAEDAVYLVPAGLERLIITREDQEKLPGRQVLVLSLTGSGQSLQVGVRSAEAYA